MRCASMEKTVRVFQETIQFHPGSFPFRPTFQQSAPPKASKRACPRKNQRQNAAFEPAKISKCPKTQRFSPPRIPGEPKRYAGVLPESQTSQNATQERSQKSRRTKTLHWSSSRNPGEPKRYAGALPEIPTNQNATLECSRKSRRAKTLRWGLPRNPGGQKSNVLVFKTGHEACCEGLSPWGNEATEESFDGEAAYGDYSRQWASFC